MSVTPEQKRQMIWKAIDRIEQLIDEGHSGTIEFRFDKGILQPVASVGSTVLLPK